MVITLPGPERTWSWAFYICWGTLGITASKSNVEVQSPFSVRHGDVILVLQEGLCNNLVIKFTATGKKANWTVGKTWGLRIFISGYDPGVLFTV